MDKNINSPTAQRWSNRIIALSVGTLLIVGISAASCGGDKASEPYKDAPRSYRDSGYAMSVIRGADGFSNVGTTCDGYGNRVMMAYHGDAVYAAITVVPNKQLADDDPCKNWRSK